MATPQADPLSRIEHIVVLQLENRSFDHMLGYLALGGWKLPDHEGELDSRVDGLDGHFNEYGGRRYASERLDQSAFDAHRLDPPHDAEEVERQIAGGAMSGFVEAWSLKLHAKSGRWPIRWAKRTWAQIRRRPYPDPKKLKAVMGYVTGDMVPVFDHLARTFCVCDRWHCSVAGPTMPNRFFSVAADHGGQMSNIRLLASGGPFKSLFRELPPDAWRWYSSDPGILRAIDGEYRLDTDPQYDHFAYFDECTEVQQRTFLSDIADETLPAVAWIDPNFAIGDMAKVLTPLDGPGSNDDHPPSRVIEAQRLVNKVYEALGSKQRYWDNTLLVVYYDEHGGFYDHVAPPNGFGPRIPALLVGGPVRRGVCHETFDHASLIKAVLERFGEPGAVGRMPAAVAHAGDLRAALRDDGETVGFVPVPDAGDAAITEDDLQPKPMRRDGSRPERAIEFMEKTLTDLQELIVKHHALPLRTGRERLSRLPTLRLARFAVNAARPLPAAKRLKDRHP